MPPCTKRVPNRNGLSRSVLKNMTGLHRALTSTPIKHLLIPPSSGKPSQKSGACYGSKVGDQLHINAHDFGMRCSTSRCPHTFGHVVYTHTRPWLNRTTIAEQRMAEGTWLYVEQTLTAYIPSWAESTQYKAVDCTGTAALNTATSAKVKPCQLFLLKQQLSQNKSHHSWDLTCAQLSSSSNLSPLSAQCRLLCSVSKWLVVLPCTAQTEATDSLPVWLCFLTLLCTSTASIEIQQKTVERKTSFSVMGKGIIKL